MSSRQSLVVAGGLGSGKSTVAAMLDDRGWQVLDADQVGHEILTEPEVVIAIAVRWPQTVRSAMVDRRKLAAVVFGDREALAALEAITHPRIVDRINSWLESTPTPRAVEVPVLRVRRPQWGPMLLVHAPESARLRRVVSRGMDQQDARRRMTAQPPEAQFLGEADFVIDNSGGIHQLRKAVATFDEWSRD